MRKKIKIIVTEISKGKYSYKGVDVETNEKLYESSFEDCTEGMVEFCGAVHGLMLIKKNNWYGDIIVGSSFIKESIESKKYKYQAKGEKSEKINDFLKRCKRWLIFESSISNIEVSQIDVEKKEEEEKEIPDVSDKFLERKTWFNRD